MKYLDSSVIIAAVHKGEADHEACARLLTSGEELVTSVHAVMEVFSVLTGGGRGFRIDPEEATRVIEANLSKRVQILSLGPKEAFQMLRLCRSRGVRGGAVHDFHHLAVARKAMAEVLHTLDTSDFEAFRRDGDPRIGKPA